MICNAFVININILSLCHVHIYRANNEFSTMHDGCCSGSIFLYYTDRRNFVDISMAACETMCVWLLNNLIAPDYNVAFCSFYFALETMIPTDRALQRFIYNYHFIWHLIISVDMNGIKEIQWKELLRMVSFAIFLI